MDEFEVNNAIKLIYSFIWNDFCDWYVEMIKNRLYADDEEIKSAVLTRAISIFEDALKNASSVYAVYYRRTLAIDG